MSCRSEIDDCLNVSSRLPMNSAPSDHTYFESTTACTNFASPSASNRQNSVNSSKRTATFTVSSICPSPATSEITEDFGRPTSSATSTTSTLDILLPILMDMQQTLTEMKNDIAYIKRSISQQNPDMSIQQNICKILPIASSEELEEFDNNLLQVDYNEAFVSKQRISCKFQFNTASLCFRPAL